MDTTEMIDPVTGEIIDEQQLAERLHSARVLQRHDRRLGRHMSENSSRFQGYKICSPECVYLI